MTSTQSNPPARRALLGRRTLFATLVTTLGIALSAVLLAACPRRGSDSPPRSSGGGMRRY